MKKNYSKRSSNAYCKKMYWLATIFMLFVSIANAQFTGAYDLSNWILTNNNPSSDASVNLSGAPNSFIFTGSDSHSFTWNAYDDFGITVPSTTTLNFDYNFSNPDIEQFYYVINGTATYVTFSGSGSLSVPVTAGDTFAFRVFNDDDCCGAGVLTISNFSAGSCSMTVSITSQTNISCNGGSDGSSTVATSGGAAPYTYLWNDSSAQTTATATSLSVGTYEVTVTDSNGCTATASSTITQPSSALSASGVATNVSCNGGNNGSIDLTVTGGTPPYTFAWSNTATTEDLAGLQANTYNVTVTDSKGCTATESVEVQQPAVISTSGVATNVSCNGGNDGAINLTVVGGTPPYTFIWSNSATTEDLAGLEANTYSVTVTDSKGCTATESVEIQQPAVLSASGVATDVSCNGGNDGAIDLTVIGGTPPYTFAWSNTATTEDLSGLSKGTYNVTVTDANGCSNTASVSIENGDNIAPTPDQTTITLVADQCEILATDITAPTATDNCGGTVIVTNDATFPITAQGTTVITWSYEDENGNISTQTQNVYINDISSPTPDAATLANITAECEVLATDVTAPTATDNCGGMVTVTNDATFPISTQGTTVITWSYEDVNGNISTQTQNVVIDDVTSPVADQAALADITMECEVLASDVPVPTATDNCGGTVSVTNDATFPITSQGTTIITWSYEDENGNISTQTQNVVIDDVTAPTPDQTTLADITMECEVLASDVINPTATDNCGGSVTVTNDVTFPITSQGTTIITWSYEDENGNTSTQTQNVVIDDVTAPVADQSTLANITAECEVLATDVTAPTATDNCGGMVSVTNDASFPISTQGTTVITWSYEDVNGNISTQTQNVVIDDVTAPVADQSTLANITTECEVLATDVTAPTATDNCSGTVTVTNDATFPISTQGTTIITWSYEDVNGNTSTQTQNVVIDDLTAPVADQATLADITMECEVLASDVPVPTATDNCGGTVTVTNDASFPISTQGTTVITWTYEDENGNISTQTQNINVLVSPIAGVTFNDATVTYDGSVHTIAVNNLPTDASVSYSTAPSTGTPNGATDAGTYTITAIVTPPATAVNCDPITLTASLTIDQAPQTIDFDALPVMMLEDDPDFQLQATASSGLPVEYTYTYTAANPPATVTPAGWVSLLTSGSIDITAAQPGNSNYLPATPVTQTLQINSRDASAHSVNIAGVTYDEPESEIYYLIECSDDQDQVSVDFETETNATVNPSHNFTMETPTPGIYRQEVVITSQDGSTTQTYMVVIEKMFPFFEIVEQKFDNVLLVNNNPTNNGGYRFVDYEWYQNGQFLGNEQYYSAGPNTTDNLDPDADYYVRMELENGDILQTCIGNVTLVHDFSASIFPNPNESGKQLNVEIDEVQISAENPLAIQLYSLQGIEVGNWRTNRNITTINLPEILAAGVYIVKCTAGRNTRTFKLIIE